MLERWPLQTLLLGTFTLWAALLALAAALGLGGRVAPHPADGALAPALPEISGPQTEQELEPFASFTEVSERPLFSPDRRPQAVQLAEGAEEEASVGNLELTSVIITPELRMALLRDTDSGDIFRVREGGVLDGRPAWRLLELQTRAAVIEGPSGPRNLTLRIFDGKGGPPPTQVRDPTPATAQPVVQQAAPAPAADGSTGGEVTSINARERAEQIRQRIEARRAELREQAARRQEAQEQ